VSGFQSFGAGCQELLIFLTGQIPSLLVLAIIVVVIVALVRRNKRKKAQRRMPSSPPQTNIPTK
jgi:sorbitol-specific phosphotransferase system component IIC